MGLDKFYEVRDDIREVLAWIEERHGIEDPICVTVQRLAVTAGLQPPSWLPPAPHTPEGTPMILRTADSNEELPDTVTLHDFDSLAGLAGRGFEVSMAPGRWRPLDQTFDTINRAQYFLVRPAPPKPIQVELPAAVAREFVAFYGQDENWQAPIPAVLEALRAALAAAGGEGS